MTTRCPSCGLSTLTPTGIKNGSKVRWVCGNSKCTGRHGKPWEVWGDPPKQESVPVSVPEQTRADRLPCLGPVPSSGFIDQPPKSILGHPTGPSVATGAKLSGQCYRHKPYPKQMPPPSIAVISATVRMMLGVSVEEFYGNTRHPLTVLARMLTVAIARRITPNSYPEIAHDMGKTGHSSMQNAMKRFEAKYGLTTYDYVRSLYPNARHAAKERSVPEALKDKTLAELAARIEAEVTGLDNRNTPVVQSRHANPDVFVQVGQETDRAD